MKAKRRILLILTLCCLCTGVIPKAQAAETPVAITTSFYPLYIAAINVTKDIPQLAVTCLTPPSAGCLHDYQLTTEDRRTMEDSDVLILNGAGLESFMDKVLPTLSAVIIDTSEGIALLEDAHGVNAHIWVSVPGMRAQVNTIASALSALYPAYAQQLAENARAYTQQLDALYEEMQGQLAPYAGAPIVTFHEAFDYFAGDFDLRIVGTVEHHHESAPSGRELASLANIIQAENVQALFAEPQYDDASVDILSRETGVPVYMLDPAVSGTADPFDYDAYLRIMRQNAATLSEALQ